MTVRALSNALKSLLSRAGVDNPDGDAREILCSVLNCAPAALIIKEKEEIDSALCKKALDMAKRRADGEPIQYVLGAWSFMGRTYKVGEGVLIPRDDTEVVTGEALRLMRAVPSPTIVDLCSGSGIIAITLAQELHGAAVCAVEKSPDAYAYLTDNIRAHHTAVTPILGDLADHVQDFDDNSIDLIISNPPYIRRAELPALQREVQYEPKMALDGGDSGYDFYEAIIRLWSSKLKGSGFIAFEIGEGQFETIAALLKENHYTYIKGYPDIQGITRAITAQKAPSATGSTDTDHP